MIVAKLITAAMWNTPNLPVRLKIHNAVTFSAAIAVKYTIPPRGEVECLCVCNNREAQQKSQNADYGMKEAKAVQASDAKHGRRS